jgi:two-component system sensor histidine kinase KdpD
MLKTKSAKITTRKSFEVEKERMHREMLSSVSHDLKTPLAAVIGSLEIYEMMKDRLSKEKVDSLIATALSEAYRLDSFVTNILDMAKLENGMVKMRRENFQLESHLTDCMEKTHYNLKEAVFKLSYAHEPITINSDPALFCRIISLLIDNAVKYGGQPPVIQVSTFLENGFGVVTIQDNGNGIPPQNLDSIFSKYSRLKNQDHQNAGTGLGLAIAREIAKLLGGSIKAENVENGGAKFILKLPIK